jgi:FkbM family methyltransferase
MSMSDALKNGLPEPLLGAMRQARAHSHRLVQWSGRGLRHTLPSGVSVAITNASDWAIYNELFVDGEYDDAIRTVTTSDAVDPLVLDLGGNVGYFALRFADLWWRARGDQPFRMVSVEGSPRTYAQLARHLAQPQLAGRCVPCHGLVGRRTGSASISTSTFSGLNSTRTRQSFSRAEVPFVDLDALLPAATQIALVKCDIEGAEELFLETYPSLLRRVAVLVVEFHPELNNVGRCRGVLHEAGLVNHRPLRAYPDGTVEMFSRAPFRLAPGAQAREQ